MVDALELYNEIVNSPLLDKKPIVLLLNKVDIFKKKVLVSPIKKYFPKFTGIIQTNCRISEYSKCPKLLPEKL